ncbi:MAG: glutamate ligase domain-containing protein, partial [Enterobacteriaceae bacterium]
GVEWEWSQQEDSWSLQAAGREITQLPPVRVPVDNAATALAAIFHSPLSVTDQAIREGLLKAQLAGRFQIIQESPRLIVDVAHNPHAAAYLAQQLQNLPARSGKLRAVMGILSDKDVTGVVAQLQPLVECWYCASLKGAVGGAGAPGLLAEELAAYVPDAQLFDSVSLAWQQAMQDAGPEDTIVVFGSFHIVAAVLNTL